jgi:hypothetical protein
MNTMGNTTYQAGQVVNQSEDDPIFDDYDDAIEAAKNGSWDDAVWAVWSLPNGDIEALVHQQRVYQ